MKQSIWIQHKGAVVSDAQPQFDARYDLIVAGLGSAGSLACITAAQRGLKVLGVDKLPLMGGSGTAGGITSYYRGIPGGLFEPIDLNAKTIEQRYFVPTSKIHPEARHLALEAAALEGGAELAYRTRVTAVYLEQNRVVGIRLLAAAGGSRDLACRMLIDATGDGEVAAMAGCAFTHGRDFDGIPQPYSHVPCRLVDNLVSAQNFDAASTASAVDGDELSRANAHGATFHLREPYAETEKFLFTGRLLGLREGRLIEGETRLCFTDYMNGRLSDVPVFFEFSNLDTHTQDWAFESRTCQEWLTVASLWGQDFTIPVPLAAMIPKGIEGLMTAGRCLSVDHDLAQAIRMQRAMQQCGEAVATAASLALQRGVSVRELDYAELAAELRRSGCLPAERPPTVDELLPDGPVAIREALASEHPGLAIWAARRQGASLQPLLRAWLADEAPDSNLARNVALALALLDDAAALPVLRRIIGSRDPFVPGSGRRLNAPRLCAALYLAGRMADAEVLDDAAALLADPETAFDVFSYAFTALLSIGEAHPGLRPRAAEGLRGVLERSDFSRLLCRHRSRWLESSTNYFRIAAAMSLDRWGLPHALMSGLDLEALSFREQALYRRSRVMRHASGGETLQVARESLAGAGQP